MYKYLGNTDILMYDALGIISVIALLSTNLLSLKKKSDFLSGASLNILNRLKLRHEGRFFCKPSFFAFIEIFIITFVQYIFLPVLTQNFGDLVHTGDNYFGLVLFIPFILMLIFYIIEIQPLKQLDMVVPAFPIALFFVKIGCFCAGCCNGFEWEKGLYNAVDDRYEFPVQLVEATLALIIFIFLLWFRKRAKEGTMFPIYLILYSGTRFFSEFLRHEEEVLWIFKTYHLLCIGGVFLGIIELILVQKYKERINAFYENKSEKRKKKARIKF